MKTLVDKRAAISRLPRHDKARLVDLTDKLSVMEYRILCGADLIIVYEFDRGNELSYCTHDVGPDIAGIEGAAEFSKVARMLSDHIPVKDNHPFHNPKDFWLQQLQPRFTQEFVVQVPRRFLILGYLAGVGLKNAYAHSSSMKMAREYVKWLDPGSLPGRKEFNTGITSYISRMKLRSPRWWIYGNGKLFLDGLSPAIVGTGKTEVDAMENLANNTREILLTHEPAFRDLMLETLDQGALQPKESLWLCVPQYSLEECINQAARVFEVDRDILSSQPTASLDDPDDRYYEIVVPTKLTPSEAIDRESEWWERVEAILKPMRVQNPDLWPSLFRVRFEFLPR